MQRTCSCIGSASAGRESVATAGNNQRSCACVGGSECSGLAARRSRVHRSQRSCVCGRSCLSVSTAPASRCGSECSRWQAGGSDCSGLALACVAVNAADLQLHWQCIRRSRVNRDGGQQPAQLRLRRWARASVAVNAADLQPAGRECIAASVVACAAAHVSAGRRRLRLGVAVNAAGGKPVASPWQ